MTRTEILSLVEGKLIELQNEVTSLEQRAASGEISQSTCKTQTQIRREKIRFLRSMDALAQNIDKDDLALTPGQIESIKGATRATGASTSSIEVVVGDTLMGLMQKYPNTKDLLAKVLKKCEDNNLVFNQSTMTIEK